MAYIEDRWLKKKKDPITGKRERTALWGTDTARYRVCGIPGVRKRSFTRLGDAKTWMATAQADQKRAEFVDPRDGEVLLADYITDIWWPARSDAIGTAGPMKSKIWNHIVDSHLGRLPMYVVDDDHLLIWVAQLRERGLSSSTASVIWGHLFSIFKSATGKRVAKNPCAEASDLRPNGTVGTKARAWTADQVVAIRSALPEWYKVGVDIGVGAGVRQGEAFGLSPEDIDERRMVLHLRRQLKWDPGQPYFKLPKGNKERDVPLSPGLLKQLRQHIANHPTVTLTLPWRGPGNGKRRTARVPLLGTTFHANPINPASYNGDVLKPALAAAGLIPHRDVTTSRYGWEPSRDMMFHRFRHTYASVQLGAGEDVVSVSHWMGHASPEITLRIYAHFLPDNGKRGRSAIDAWLSAG